jgi:eukaryotic-like serine/threonine-protein kinase
VAKWADRAGGYSVVCALASGGMGRVDLVARREQGFQRLFAQKRLRPHLVDDADVRRMFLDEGRIAGLIRHPNVVSVVDVGEDAAGPYLVLDFVEGIALSDLVARTAARGERVPLAVCLPIAIQIAEGLRAAHELRGPDDRLLGLIHRDVSPQNVLVGFDGIARVTDFGIAKVLGRPSQTTNGVLKGKLGYLAPERLRFEEPDRRADLFSFGVVLYELLAGRRLYDSADAMEGPRRILHEPPPDIAEEREDVEPELVELLFELLAKDRAHRPPDAGLVARRLERILASVIAADGPADTGAYVRRLFAAEEAALRTKISSLEALPPVAGPRRRHRPRLGRIARAGAVSAALSFVAVLAIAAGRHRAPAEPAASPVVASTSAQPTAAENLATAAVPATTVGAGRPASVARRRSLRRKPARPTPAGAEDCRAAEASGSEGDRQLKLRCLVDVRR